MGEGGRERGRKERGREGRREGGREGERRDGEGGSYKRERGSKEYHIQVKERERGDKGRDQTLLYTLT